MVIGMELGTHWEHIEVIGIRYIKPLSLIAVLGTFLYLFFSNWRNKRKD
jgi:hypothetical protein